MTGGTKLQPQEADALRRWWGDGVDDAADADDERRSLGREGFPSREKLRYQLIYDVAMKADGIDLVQRRFNISQ